MVGPGVVPDAVVDRLVRVPRPFGAELPYRPLVAVTGVEEGDEAVEGVAVGALGVGLAGAGAGMEGVSGRWRKRTGGDGGRDKGGTNVAIMLEVT